MDNGRLSPVLPGGVEELAAVKELMDSSSYADTLKNVRGEQVVSTRGLQQVYSIQREPGGSMKYERSPEPQLEVRTPPIKRERGISRLAPNSLDDAPRVKRKKETPRLPATTMGMTSGNKATSVGSTNDHTIELRCLISRLQARFISDGLLDGGNQYIASGLTCHILDAQKGAGERILVTRGTASDVSKHLAHLIDLWAVAENSAKNGRGAGMEDYDLRVLVPEVLILKLLIHGSRVQGYIEECSAAQLIISKSCLPRSTERLVSIRGLRDAIHIATYYLALCLIEQLVERFGDTGASAYGTISGHPACYPINKLLVVPYSPQSLCGSYGNPVTMKRQVPKPAISGEYSSSGLGLMQVVQDRINNINVASYSNFGNEYTTTVNAPLYTNPIHVRQSMGIDNALELAHTSMYHSQWQSDQGQTEVHQVQTTQHIYVPNEMVGAIIGKGGAKIKELRQLSGSHIKIDSDDGEPQRRLTVVGSVENNAVALMMLQMRLEGEKHRV